MSTPAQARRLLVRYFSLGVIIAALTTGAAVVWKRQSTSLASEAITMQAPGLGGHVLIPDLDQARMVVPDRPHDPSEARAENRHETIQRLRTFFVSTNSRGMRGPEIKPKHGFRILAVGDSVTFGWGVAGDETFPAQLSTLLGVEVLNGGVPAWKPPTMAAWTQRVARELAPDLVLFTRRPDMASSDPWLYYTEAVGAVVEAVAPAPVAVIMPPVSTFDVMGSRQYQAEYQRATQLVRPTPVLDLTDVFRREVSAKGLPGVQMEQISGPDGMVQRVRSQPDGSVVLEVSAPRNGLAPEVVALFEDDGDVAEPLFFDGGHPDAAGFGVFTREVARWLRERRLVPEG